MSTVAKGLEGEESERMAAGEISTLYRGAPEKISSVLKNLFTLDNPPWPLLYHTLLPSYFSAQCMKRMEVCHLLTLAS